jgi:HPt (histidine-containing phosphotransfer) domain-containing protein
MERNNDSGPITVKVDSDLEDIIPGFLQHRQSDIEAILDALDKGDYETIRILGHNMKGAGGGYGFEVITDIGSAIEEAAKINDAAEIKRSSNELSRYLERIEIVFEPT